MLRPLGELEPFIEHRTDVCNLLFASLLLGSLEYLVLLDTVPAGIRWLRC